MTTKPLPQFWNALNELPGAATDRRDWVARLGAEFRWAQRFLRATGCRAAAIDCPSPGGDGCPRAVIRAAGGALRAVCRSSVGRCDSIDLTPADVDVLELDIARLRQALATTFAVHTGPGSPISSRVSLLGGHAIAAGVEAPVMLLVPGPMDVIQLDELREGGLGSERAVLLVPTVASLPPSTRARLASLGHLVLSLSDVTEADGKGNLVPVQPMELLLHDIRAALRARLGTSDTGPAIALEPGTTWSQLTLRLTSTATVICSTPGLSRQMDPADFGMRSAKNAKPIAAWTLLVALAAAGGILQPQRRALADQVKKQKQILAGHLRRTFGIRGDPIPWDPKQRAYVAAFLISDDRSRREREINRHR
jgi:hypothetical protein